MLVTTTSVAGQFLSRSTAGSERIAWVAAMITPAAPSAISASAAFTIVPPVSIMSSTSTQIRPVDVTDDPVGDGLVGPVGRDGSCG